MSSPTEFWKTAHAAIKIGLITLDEARMIVRPGTRKQNYWDRHRIDLLALIEQRLEERRVPDNAGK